MINFWNRLVSAWRVIIGKHVIVIEAKPNPAWRDDIPAVDRPPASIVTMWGTEDDKYLQVDILSKLVESIEFDIEEHTFRVQGTEAGDVVIDAGDERVRDYRVLLAMISMIERDAVELELQDDGRLAISFMIGNARMINTEYFMLTHCDDELKPAHDYKSIRRYLVDLQLTEVFLRVLWKKGRVRPDHPLHEQLRRRFER